MASKSADSSNIQNRSPWVVEVRSKPALNKRFSFSQRSAAQRYYESLGAQGLRAQFAQLENSFQLRLRRKGVKTQFITFYTWQEAEQARLKIESDLSVSIVRDYSAATKHTLRDLMERYLEKVVPSHKGAEIEGNRLRRMMRDEAFVDKRLAALSTEDLQDFINDRLTEVAPGTVDRDVDLISQVLHYADDVWKIAAVESPLKGLRRPEYCNERDRRLSKKEEKALLEAARADENPYLAPAIILGLETAMRRSELLALTSTDINYERRYAHLKDTKNGRSRKVPLSTRAMQVLKALEALNQEGEGPLLDLTPNALKLGFFNRVLPAAKITDFHFHDLRHEAISRFAESGRFQLIELQAISGHRDMRMLQRYAHLCSGNLGEKMDAIKTEGVKTYLHHGRRRVVAVSPELETHVEARQPSKRPRKVAGAAGPNVVDFSTFSARRRCA